MSDTLFDTWDGDNSTFEEDLARVLGKHGIQIDGISEEQLPIFVAATLRSLEHAAGSTSEFTTSMFMLYKELEVGSEGRQRFARRASVQAVPRA